MSATIDIEGEQFAYYPKHVDKLASEEGCPLQVAEKVHNLDDESYSDEDENVIEPEIVRGQNKFERMKKDFLSITLNANRDPTDRNNKSILPRLFTEEKENEHNESDQSDIYEFAKYDDGYSRIHKRYKHLGNFEELISKKENGFESISESDLVYKRQLIVGSGPLVDENSIVIYNCAFWTEGAKEPYDSTWLRHNTFVTDLSSDSILPGLHSLLLTAKKGEWSEAFIRPKAAFGPLGAMPRIPPNATIFCLLEVGKVISRDKIALISHNPTSSQELGISFEDFYLASDESRKRGNHYHDRRQYKVALQRYKAGIRILEALTYKDEMEESKAKQLLIKLYNNTARAANASGLSRLALGACKQASLLDDLNPKTHWNRMVAWKTMGHLDKALGSARRAIQLFHDPKTNRSFQREAETLKKELQRKDAESDNLFRIMGSMITG